MRSLQAWKGVRNDVAQDPLLGPAAIHSRKYVQKADGKPQSPRDSFPPWSGKAARLESEPCAASALSGLDALHRRFTPLRFDRALIYAKD